MQESYDGLWKLYLFLHPVFHSENFKKIHEKIEIIFLKFALENTEVIWKNAINFNQLLLEEPMDIYSFLEKSDILYDSISSEKNSILYGLSVFVGKISMICPLIAN